MSSARPESGRRRFLGNFASLSGLQIATYLLPLVTVPYLVRVLGAEKFGLIGFAQALIQYFLYATEYGFNLTATRAISLQKDDRAVISEVFCSVLAAKLAILVAGFAVLCALVFAVPKFRADGAVYFLTFGTVIGSALFPLWFFQGIERMTYISVLNILSKIIFTAAIFVFVRQPSDFIYVPLISSIGMIVPGGLGLIIAFRRFGVALVRPSWASLRRQFVEGWPVFISIVGVAGYMNTRLFAVGLFTTNEVTGYFRMAEQLIAVVQLFPLASLVQALYPRLTRIHAEDPGRGLRLMKRFQRISTLFYLIFLPVLAGFAPEIIRIVFGRPYEVTIVAFRLLLVGVFFMNMYVFSSNFLLVMGRNDLYMKVFLVAGAVGAGAILVSGYFTGYIGILISVNVVALGILVWMIRFYTRLGKMPIDKTVPSVMG